MNTLPYDAVLFDLDGTLVDSEEGILGSVEFALTELGLPIPDRSVTRGMIGPPLYDGFTGILGLPRETALEAMEIYRAYFLREGMYRYTVYPQIRTILQMLRNGGAFVAVATSKPLEPAMALLDYFGLTHYFDRISCVPNDGHVIDKPELIRNGLPERYTRAAMVGDRCFDMEGARANNIDAIGAAYGFGDEEELVAAGATHVVPDTEALRALLCRGEALPRGFFLSVEGLDGSGKTTQVDLLEKKLRDFGFSVLRTREPGGCPISEDIRRMILDTQNIEMSAQCEALLYAASRAQHVRQIIRPAVERGGLVLCDRFVDSSIAYQGGGRELGVDVVQAVNDLAVGDMTPDATLYLAIDHTIALERRHRASSFDRLEMEASAFHERVQRAYERLIHENRRRYLVIDAMPDVDTIAREAFRQVFRRLEPEWKDG